MIVAGACQLASWLFAVVDAIEAPKKRKALPREPGSKTRKDL